MALSWSGRRQLMYTAAVFVLAFLAMYGAYQTFFTAPATCSDGKQNGGEHGVDCGGSCSLVCPGEARAPTVAWARSFPVAGGMYTAVAYVGNANVGAGARAARYSFQLFDAKNSLIVERDGIMDLPPVSVVPVIESNVDAGTRAVARTLFAFSSAPSWNKIPAKNIPALDVSDQALAQDGSRLSATVTNQSLIDANGAVVTAVLFDAQDIALAASKSMLDVPAKTSEPLVFTWPAGIPNVARAEITILPQF